MKLLFHEAGMLKNKGNGTLFEAGMLRINEMKCFFFKFLPEPLSNLVIFIQIDDFSFNEIHSWGAHRRYWWLLACSGRLRAAPEV